MKKLIIPTIALFLMMVLALCVAFGQTTEYQIDKYFQFIQRDTFDQVSPLDSIQVDSVFSYSFSIITVSPNERDTLVDRSGGLSENSVQQKAYSNVRSAYDRIARLEVQIRELNRLRNVSLSALNPLGLNDYFSFERDRVRKRLNGTWIVIWDGERYLCNIRNDSGALRTSPRDKSGLPPNTLIGRIVPRSAKYFTISLDISLEVVPGENIDIYSADGDTYQGEDTQGTRMILRQATNTN
jgi:hypothetical protein